MKRWLLLLAFATRAFAGDDLEKRLEPFRDPERYRIHAAVYDRYASGRPRRGVAAIGNAGEGDLWLFRFPDSANGKPRVLDKQELGSGPAGLELMRIIHPKDIVVTLFVRHGESATVEHVVDDHLVEIADGFTEALDLDGDGVPEIIDTGYAGQNDCGVREFVALGHWNGKKFVWDDRQYVTLLGINGSNSDDVLLSAEKRYAVRLFGRGRVTLDQKPLAAGTPFRVAEGCHRIELQDGDDHSRAFLEELP